MNVRSDKQQVKITAFTICPDNKTADRLSVLHDPIRFTAVNRFLYRASGDYLSLLLEMVVSSAEFFQGTIVKCFLIILYKLLPIILC